MDENRDRMAHQGHPIEVAFSAGPEAWQTVVSLFDRDGRCLYSGPMDNPTPIGVRAVATAIGVKAGPSEDFVGFDPTDHAAFGILSPAHAPPPAESGSWRDRPPLL